MAGRRKRRQEPEEHVSHERWLVSYADMVTLLMCLFIVLFAMATVDQKKFAALAESLNADGAAAATVLGGSQSVVNGGELRNFDDSAKLPSVEFELPTSREPEMTANQKEQSRAVIAQALERQEQVNTEKENLDSIQQEIQAALLAKGQQDSVKFQRTERGLVITVVTDAVLFDLGKADVRPQSSPLLNALGVPLRHIDNEIVVEGHTDDTPLRGTGLFPTNWELSTARATSVLRYLVEKEGVPATKIGAMGFGQERPIASNADAVGKSLNRRVEVVVLSNVGALD